MRLQRNLAGTRRRRAIILLVVLVMLVLFSIAGLTFVLYAEAASQSAGTNRDAESQAVSNAPDMDPSTSFNYFLGQLIYGVPDVTPGSTDSALRGHSLAENMYGGFDSLGTVPSDVPFNGQSRLSEPNLYSGTDGNQMVNYMYFAADGFVRDPSRPGTRANPSAARTTYTGGQNPPYTFPDANCMALATINPATGQVTNPSFYRAAVFGGDWNSPAGKYKTLRPRPVDNSPTFPMPDPNTGCDVSNLQSSQRPDSPWIDIGAPELYTASGLRYKMLVAPLILDLDNRVNLNVVGNVFATGNANGNYHAGNQGGWGGAWEVNMSRVLNVDNTEWKNVFLGNAGIIGRYGSGGLPTSVYPLNGPTPHAYAPGDLNGVNDPGQTNPFTATLAWMLPQAGAADCFPSWPSAGYGNNLGGVEIQNSSGQTAHPMFYDPMHSPTSGGSNRTLPLYSHATLMYGGPGAAANLDLAKLCPGNFAATGANASTTIKRIMETTLLSMDLERPGASAYVWDTTNPNYTIFYNPATGAYTGAAPASDGAQPTTFPALGSTPPATSEFDPTWRSLLPRILPRLDLDRQLAVYPASGAQPPDRQAFAQDIYTRLLAATGMTGVNANIASSTPQQYLTLRWLAQLSANIVDYIDTDDIMTAFTWTTSPQNGDTGIVYGTELPKLVLNETYLQYNNDPNDPFPKNAMGTKTASLPYQMNVYTELVNPLPTGADANGANNATLVNSAGSPVYQIVLSKTNNVQASSYGAAYPKGIRRPENNFGDPDNSTQPYTGSGNYNNPKQVLSVVSSLAGGQQVVTPMGSSASGPAGGNTGYYVVGPSTDATVTPVSYQTPGTANAGTGMVYTVPLTDGTAENPVPPTLLLQRLANPTLPFNAATNPYITVDYVDMSVKATVNDARQYGGAGLLANGAVDTRYSYGRTEPYAAAASQLKQQPHNASGNGQPSTTFYNINSPQFNGTGPNHWLVHMDRPLMSPIELAGVSAFKPYELTQQFIADVNGTTTPYQHLAPWTDVNTRLYRLLEFVKVKNTTAGVVAGGRVPGHININTIDPQAFEVFRALCDAEPGNLFYGGAGTPDTNVDAVFQALMAQRASRGPFLGMAPGAYQPGDLQYPNGAGLASTLLAGAANLGAAHPYQNLELLNKIYNNTTTRSNVFAVWLTVGFFQITDDQTTPMKLGPEINAAAGKNIRHHMFAIIDRTQITTFTTKVGGGGVTASFNAATATWNPVPINVPTTVTDARTTVAWNIIPGTTLVYDPGAANEETVVVQPGGTALFTQSHAAGATVISRGNPGPWTKYDPAQDGQVVPYLVIID